ncbi:hypothetical protein EV363DRAFT_1165835, partial [Boletus edulis]
SYSTSCHGTLTAPTADSLVKRARVIQQCHRKGPPGALLCLIQVRFRTPSQTIVWANPNSEQAGCQLSSTFATIRWNSAVSTMAGSFGSRPEVNSLQKVRTKYYFVVGKSYDRLSSEKPFSISDMRMPENPYLPLKVVTF